MKKVLTPYQSFMLKAQTALATGHFHNQLGFWGAAVPPPVQARMYSTSDNVQCKSGTLVVSTNKDMWYEQGISSGQMGICSTKESLLLLMYCLNDIIILWQASKID